MKYQITENVIFIAKVRYQTGMFAEKIKTP